MFSKLNFLGVARATKTTAIAASATTLAKAVAGVATSAKKTGAVKKFTAFTAMALMAFGFMGCDDAKDLVDGAKSLAASVSIEQPIVTIEGKVVEKKVKDPFFGTGLQVGTGEYAAKYFIKITSKDNETQLENVIINRGNCGVKKYQLNKQAYQAYAKENPDYTFAGVGTKLATKSGELVDAKQGIFSDNKSLEAYNALENKAKALYELAPEFSGKKLPFGSSAIFYPNCKADSIIEIELTANGGKSVYSFEQGGY